MPCLLRNASIALLCVLFVAAGINHFVSAGIYLQREGMLSGFTLGNYLMLVEYTGRLLREGKASISSELTDIFERLGSSAALWQARLQKLSVGRGLGRFLSTSRERLREVAQKLGVHHLANLDGCPA